MDFIRYILTATACLSIAYCGFLLFINNRTGFHQQRMFLAASLIISLVLPATGISLKLPVISGSQDPIIEGFGFTAASSGIVSVPAEPVTALLGDPGTYILIYVIVSSALLLFFAASLIRILRYYILSERKEVSGQKILVNHEISGPFSFFGWIFVPAALSIEDESNNIIVHEGIHAAQYHSADNIAVELTAALMWFNPLVWMMKRSFHLLHEYLADEGTLGRGIDRISYQSLLINQATEGRLISFSSSFNNSLKKRMIMMTNGTKMKNTRGRVMFMIPLSLILFTVTGIINGLFSREALALPVAGPEMDIILPATEIAPVIQQDTATRKTITIVRTAGEKSNRKDKEEIKVVAYGSEKSIDTVLYWVDGKNVKDIHSIPADSIESVSVMKDANVIMITTKKPAGKVVVVKPGKGSLEEHENILYIIDGEESEDQELMRLIDPSDIESVEVLKGDENLAKAGKKGYDGIIIVKTRKK